MNIVFNKPYLTGKEILYIKKAVKSGKISGNGMFTHLCDEFFSSRFGFNKCMLSTSCTDALEMAAILTNISPGDEIIIPSFTFVSTALAFVRQGAKIIFVDSHYDHPGINEDSIEELITEKTKVIVPVHYGGVACNMDKINSLAQKYHLFIVEDAAQALDSYYIDLNVKRKPLGSIGHLGCFSFHETKNIQCGEGGMLAINDQQFEKRAEIIWEKGTNRAEFFRGEVDKYGWVDTGSSFLPSEIIAAFLYAQLENIERIQIKRKRIWNTYFELLKPLQDKGFFKLPYIPDYATNNAHMFYLVCNSLKERTKLIYNLKKAGIMAVFHYQSLHKSQFYQKKHDGRELLNSDRFTDCLVRLPLYYELSLKQIEKIYKKIKASF